MTITFIFHHFRQFSFFHITKGVSVPKSLCQNSQICVLFPQKFPRHNCALFQMNPDRFKALFKSCKKILRVSGATQHFVWSSMRSLALGPVRASAVYPALRRRAALMSKLLQHSPHQKKDADRTSSH